MNAERRPNFLFFFPDQQRPDFLGFNEDLPTRTPNLEEMSRRGVRFTNCYTPSPVCAPARACLASGRWYDSCGVSGNDVDYPLDQPTYYRALRQVGYYVLGCGKFDLHKATNDWGLDGKRLIHEWGFTDGIDNEGKYDGVISGTDRPMGPYMAYLHERGLAEAHSEDLNGRGYDSTYPTPLDEEAYCDNWLSENGLRLLGEVPVGEPWHLVVNFTGPHNPMDVTERMRRRWEDAQFPPAHNNDRFDGDTHCRIRQNYAAMVENIDRQMGRFIEEVQRRGELENTVIIYSADHGEMLGDHNCWGKGTWREPSAHVPLVVSAPDSLAGHESNVPVGIHDLAATILDYAAAGPLKGMEARSLRGLLTGKQEGPHHPYVLSGLHDWRMIFDGRYKLVRRREAEDLLFDLQEDPREDCNIAAQEPELAAELGRELRERTGWDPTAA